MERKQAIEQGLAKFITGRPCKYGHTSERNTVTGACLECVNNRNKEYQQKARDMIKAKRES